MKEWSKQLEEHQRELANLQPLSEVKNIYWVEQKPVESMTTMNADEFMREFGKIRRPDMVDATIAMELNTLLYE